MCYTYLNRPSFVQGVNRMIEPDLDGCVNLIAATIHRARLDLNPSVPAPIRADAEQFLSVIDQVRDELRSEGGIPLGRQLRIGRTRWTFDESQRWRSLRWERQQQRERVPKIPNFESLERITQC